MADQEHVKILLKGAGAWNEWRDQHPTVTPDLIGAALSGADLLGANLIAAHLRGADLRGANLIAAHFSGADLSAVDLGAADLSWADLREVDLRGAKLRKVDLRGANLSRADLSRTDLRAADLREADLSDAKLSAASLLWADLRAADLSDADLCRAKLFGTDLSGADLSGATLEKAQVQRTVFGDVDLSAVMGLESIYHLGPSTVGIDTIYRSKGNIPEVFLRGAGVPDVFIVYMRSLVGKPFEFYSCFISYSSKDQDFAERLYADLQSKGVRCWFAPHDIKAGQKLHEQIDEAIRLHEKLLLILSPHSMNSEWVKTEITKARKREMQEKRQVLFPVRLCSFEALRDWECFDADTGKDLAREIREYFIPDFSNWKDHDSYRNAFERLLRDLKAEKPVSKPA